MPYIIFGTSSWSLPEPRYSNTPSDFFSIFKFENEIACLKNHNLYVSQAGYGVNGRNKMIDSKF